MNTIVPLTYNCKIPVCVDLPEKAGGYLLVAGFTNDKGEKTINRRYIKIGELGMYSFYNIEI